MMPSAGSKKRGSPKDVGAGGEPSPLVPPVKGAEEAKDHDGGTVTDTRGDAARLAEVCLGLVGWLSVPALQQWAVCDPAPCCCATCGVCPLGFENARRLLDGHRLETKGIH